MAFNRIIQTVIGPSGQPGKLLSELRMSFEIVKTQENTPNVAKVKIYNLKKDTALELGRIGNKLILQVGYEDEGGLKNLFIGDISRATIRKEETETILDLEALDGTKEIDESNISVSFSENTSSSQVLNDFINVLGLPLGNNPVITHKKYIQGFSFIGKAKDGLTNVLENLGMKWFIENGQLFIYRIGEEITARSLILSANSGLIESPEPLEDKNGDGQTDDTPKRYTIKSLLFPQLVPGSTVQVQSELASGNFIIQTGKYVGDNWDGDFMATLEVRQL